MRPSNSQFDAKTARKIPSARVSIPTPDQLLESATERHRAGAVAEARALYQQVLAESPAHTVALFRAGLLELQDAHPDAALVLVEQAVAAAPGEARYQLGLGQVLQALKHHAEAAAAYRRALQAEPRCADAHFALGISLQSLGHHADAAVAYQAAAQLQPDFSDAFNNLGNCQRLCGRFPQAAAAYGQALALRPDHVGAMSNLATVLQEMGRIDEAVGLLRAAVEQQPDVGSHALNLGIALCRQRNFGAAAVILRRQLEKNPDDPAAAFNLGNALHGLGQSREAADQYRHALELRPDYADALNNLGNIHRELGEFRLAQSAYESAIRVRPDYVVAFNNLGCLLRRLGRLEDAEAMLRRGLQLQPGHSALIDNLGSVLKDAGELEPAIACFRSAVALDPGNPATHSNLAYALSFQSLQGSSMLEECRRWNERFAAGLQISRSYPNDSTPQRRLRIGYVSPDFRDHCQSLFTIPLLSRHDHAGFEIFCYASVERPDDCTRRIAGLADVWRDVRMLDDETLAGVIRGDQIDILVDLTMHMANGRPLLFARKPAPVEIAWLAYPGTTGIDAIDYRFTDPRLDPKGFEDQYSEHSVRLPDSFWCYDPLTDQPTVNALPALESGYLTFGCLNNPCKVTDATLQLWGGVLRSLPQSRLRLLAPPGRHRRQLLQRLAAHGIAAQRVSFVPYRPRADYLRQYHDIDIALDTFPYNGHTTSLDSLWMGVPTITRVGETCVGRGGLSQLFQLDLVELAAETDSAFTAAALALANDLLRLAELRRGLRARLERSPLMDAGRFARNVEAAYRSLWSRHCAAVRP